MGSKKIPVDITSRREVSGRFLRYGSRGQSTRGAIEAGERGGEVAPVADDNVSEARRQQIRRLRSNAVGSEVEIALRVGSEVKVCGIDIETGVADERRSIGVG